MFTKLINYFKDVRIEMRKVEWPTRSEWINHTITVIVVTIAVALVLSGFDLLFTRILKYLV